MTRQNLTLKQILNLLNNKGPLTLTEIKNILNLERSTQFRNLRIAKKKKWIEEVEPDKYNITTLGKLNIETSEKQIGSFNFEVYSQVLGLIDIHSEKPRINCIIEIEKADKIKQMDNATKAELRFSTNDGLWLPENNTNLKASVACVADSLLDNVAKDKGLYKMLNEEFRKKRTLFNFEQMIPGYDYRKRLMDLAKTKFNVLIEYNGEEWVKNQDFNELDKSIANSQLKHKRILEISKRKQNINRVIDIIDDSNYKSNEHHLLNKVLFKVKEDLECFISKCLKKQGIENNHKIEKIKKEFFNSGLLKIKERNFYCLEMDKEKLSEFYSSIDELININDDR